MPLDHSKQDAEPAAAQTLEQQIAELKAAQARYRAMVENGPSTIWVLDVEQMCFVETSENSARLFKRPREELIGLTPLDLAPPLQADGRPTPVVAQELIGRVLAGERVVADWIVRDALGNDIPVELHAHRLPVPDRMLICGATLDMTQRRRTEAALAYRVKFESLITRLSTGMISLTPERIDAGITRALAEVGEFAQVDRSYVFEFDEARSHVTNTHEWCAPGVEPEIQRLQGLRVADFPWVEDQLQRGEVVHVPRVRDLPPEAAAERTEWSAEAICSILLVPMQSGGSVRGYVGFDSVRGEKQWPPEIIGLLRIFGEIVMNALTRKHAETALRLKNEALERTIGELERSNEELQQFAYIASHDLQEPLRSISGFSSLLKQRYGGRFDADADEFIRYIVDSAARLQRLITDLLDYSRIQSRARPFEPCSAETALQAALAHLSGSIAELRAQVTHEPLPQVLGDPSQLMQLFQNLVGNALKFHGAEAPRVHVSAAAGPDGTWVMSVRDNGIGIPPPEAQRVFQIFKRLHNTEKYPGSGIGLAVCKRIVERHRGRIWVEPGTVGGSLFRFTLPGAQPRE